ncbi:MAG: DUF1990 domain-containing protein [Ilumatobacteraceae bacterium]
MPIHLVRPSTRSLRSLLEDARGQELTYSPIGISTASVPPPGYHHDRWSRRLAGDEGVFERAADALRNWQVQRGAGLVVESVGPPTVGVDVVMAARLPVGYIDVVCRVVDVVDEPDRSGFTYGTLEVHPEQGEESFIVSRAEDGTVTFEVVASSRPRHMLARAAPPVARFLQAHAAGRYLSAMESAVAS